uniref:Integrase core domain containing protein n=1 Tax=Solanum tuberosum TaxID=4113 RepID=M1DFQ0_SOLTU
MRANPTTQPPSTDCTLTLKLPPTYTAKGKLKFVAPSFNLIDEDEDVEYIPPPPRHPPLLHVLHGIEAGSSNNITSSFFEEDSAGDIPVLPCIEPAPVAEETNRWCVDGQYQIYRDACMLNENDNPTRLITEEHQDLKDSLHIAPIIEGLFHKHRCKWIARPQGTYNEEIVKDFYASYAGTITGSISKRANPATHPLLEATLVRGFSMDISKTTFHRLFPTQVDNVVTWDRAVIVVAMVAGLERARDIGVNPSSGINTTDGVVRVDESITEGAKKVAGSATDGVPSIDTEGSGKLDLPTC